MPRQIVLASRPSGWPTAANFALTEVDPPDLADGQVRVRNLFMSVDPYMRGRMNDVKSYVPPFRLGRAARGRRDRRRSPRAGRPTWPRATWSCTCSAGGTRRSCPPGTRRSWRRQGLSPSAYLGVLGMPALTAYVGLLDIAGLKEGDVVFVSGAAGAVGSIAGQIAKLKGAARVIGSAGSDEKVRWLREIGFDAAFNYKAGLRPGATARGRARRHRRLLRQRRRRPPGRLPGGAQTPRPGGHVRRDRPLQRQRTDARPHQLGLVITKRLTLRGFIVIDHQYRLPDMIADVSRWLADGKLAHAETVVDGLENAPAAFIDLLRGANTGKMIVRL